jgi:transketolase
MRGAFAKTLADLAEHDPRIMLLTGDLGFMALEPFSEKFPDRFINVGVAEQNMVGLATGLAESGFIPFVYSIITFATLRPYEFIRNGPVLQNLPVRIVGVGGGFEYGTAGPTHHGLEDLAIMRAQPGLTVIAPADHEQTRAALRATWNLPGPVYYRLGKDDKAVVAGLNGQFGLGKAQLILDGPDVGLVTVGSIAVEALVAAERLAARGIRASILVVASVQPFPTEDAAAFASRFPLVLTAEAHYAAGGLGSMVSEVIAERGLKCRLVRCAVDSPHDGRSGSTAHLYRKHGLTGVAIAETAERRLCEVSG